MTFSGELLAFMILAIVAIMGGILLLNLNKVVHMVVALLFTFVSIAGIFVLLSAEFVAVVQILIYAGSITIIMLFGIMLTRHREEREPTGGVLRRILLFLGILGFAFALYIGIYNLDMQPQESSLHVNNVEQIGMALFTKYVIPFELTSVILLVALIGAIILARNDRSKEADEE